MKHLLNASLLRESNKLLIIVTFGVAVMHGFILEIKRENHSKSCGPELSLHGQDHKQVFVRHGSELVRVHSNRLIHVDNVSFEKSSSSDRSNIHQGQRNEYKIGPTI